MFAYNLTGLSRDEAGQYSWTDGQVTNVEQGFWALDQPLGFQHGNDLQITTFKSFTFCICHSSSSYQNSDHKFRCLRKNS